MEDEKELLDDIYEDFDQKLSSKGLRDYEELERELENKTKREKEYLKKYNDVSSVNELLKKQNAVLKKKNEVLTTNISCIYATAKAEIERYKNENEELMKKLKDLQTVSKDPAHRRHSQGTFNSAEPRHPKDQFIQQNQKFQPQQQQQQQQQQIHSQNPSYSSQHLNYHVPSHLNQNNLYPHNYTQPNQLIINESKSHLFPQNQQQNQLNFS